MINRKQNNKSSLYKKYLYEYAVHAVCCPLHVFERAATIDELAAHVAESWSVRLSVDVKRARNLSGEDQNGLMDPYCNVSGIHIPSIEDNSTKNQFQPLMTNCKQGSCKSSSGTYSIDRTTTVSSNDDETLKSISYLTQVQPQTINPEWNEHFELYVVYFDLKFYTMLTNLNGFFYFAFDY
ncbi:unnamed protein product [Rotaria sp. Silwood1]|nr:unnamed protein product [Rotaria sp. Silwood1]CAF1595478.1 unnamed protein product [Rotaria sp. Silwood1]